ncbi:hypothetical protein ETB97_005306 [Aspergillus alliaceus]|uniref:Uncharacterized protein n=1 Tax=Petromyces alliaceus TaxID=209559 RepID=A0A8H6EBT8_PETAA|nr:hypothetical protein ETB97_005306 [Aspergillus burnettii]
MTVTVPPEQDKVTGSPAMITTFASAGNGTSAGYVGIELDPAVAAHLQALLAGSDTSNCDLSDDFFNPIRVRQLDLSNNICGAETILTDGIGRGGYPDCLLMNPAASLNLTITGTQLHGLAFGAFTISWVYFNNGSITTNNVVPSALQCGAECGVFAWASQFDCTTVTSCDAQPALTTTVTTTKAASGPSPTGDSSGGKGQQIAVVSYINPLADPAAWDRLIEYPVEKMPISPG